MLSLVYKDFYQQRKNLRTFLAVVTVVIVAFSVANPGASTFLRAFVTVMMVYSFVLRTAYDEDKNKTFAFLCSLPISKGRIVASKYLSGLLVVLGGYLFAYLVESVINFIRLGNGFAPINPVETGAALFVGLLILSIFLAVFFAFGYARAITSLRYFFLSFFLIPVIVPALKSVVQREWAEMMARRVMEFVQKAQTTPMWNAGLALAAAGLVVTALSAAIALRSFARKDVA